MLALFKKDNEIYLFSKNNKKLTFYKINNDKLQYIKEIYVNYPINFDCDIDCEFPYLFFYNDLFLSCKFCKTH